MNTESTLTMRALVLALCTWLLLVPAIGATIPALVEEVDVASLALTTVTLTYSFTDEGPLPRQDVLEKRCTVLSSALTCTAAIDEPRRQVIFTVVSASGLSIDDLELGHDTVSVSFGLEHKPLQFVLSPAITAVRRELLLRYPTHETVVTDLRDAPVSSTFTLRKDSTTADIDLPDGPFVAGDAVALPAAAGTLCIGALLRDDDPLVIADAPGCEPFFLGVPPTLRPGSYTVAMVVLGSGDAGVARSDIRVSGPLFPFNVTLDAPVVRLGEPVLPVVASDDEVETCAASLVLPGIGEMAHAAFEDCTRIALGTSTAWNPGRYLLQVTAKTSEGSAAVSLPVTLEGLAVEPANIVTDREDYRPGEELVVHIQSSGEACETVVLDDELAEVLSEDGCGERKIQLDDTIEPGTYVVQTRVYAHGRLTGMASRAIEVREWQPIIRSPMESLCPRGSFSVDGEPIPCIGNGQQCSPSSMSIPVCLCFDEGGEPLDACQPTDRCTPEGCRPEPTRSPYIIVQVPGSCTARRGSEVFGCIGPGEMCDGYCVCLDDKGPVSPCDPGQTCTPNGCIATMLEFDAREVKPREIDASSVLEGTTIVWSGILRREGGPLDAVAAADVTARGRIGFLPPQNASVDVSGTTWQLSLPVEGRLPPGAYDAVMEVYHREHLAAVRRSVSVLYPLDARELTIEVLRASPGRIDAADLKLGVSLRLELAVRNSASEPVGDLRPEDLILSLEELRPDAVAATFDPDAGTWGVVATFQSASLPGSNYLLLEIISLGRRGTARILLDVVNEAPAALHISHISPGSADRPLFHLLMSVGFSMDIHLSITSQAMITLDDFTVTMGGTDITAALSHIVSTDEGVKLHLSRARLPPGPATERSSIELIVTMDGPGGALSDSVPVMTEGNPGNWRNEQGGGA
ncbi:MAG: hypothetical protein QGG50_05775 [Methanopyri archaeon]|jgi:hypothetical protein|nr:hypothetical protein [Methanopyri archaeon]